MDVELIAESKTVFWTVHLCWINHKGHLRAWTPKTCFKTSEEANQCLFNYLCEADLLPADEVQKATKDRKSAKSKVAAFVALADKEDISLIAQVEDFVMKTFTS